MPVTLVTLTFILLLPIVPAMLIFWLLPSSAMVSGPFQGFRIDLSGGFAGYFALVLLVLFSHNVWAPAPTYQVWEVSGKVTNEQGLPFGPLRAKNLALTPPALQTGEGGTFTLSFVASPDPGGGGAISYPQLNVSYPGYLTQTIPLDPSLAKQVSPGIGVVSNVEARHITINQVALQQLPPYARGQAPLHPVSPPQEVHP